MSCSVQGTRRGKMTQRSTIWNELNELGSVLTDYDPRNVYAVPGGYFEKLPYQVLDRIKALETSNAKEELELLSPLLTQVNRKMPFSIPKGYFETLDEKIMQGIREHADYQSPGEELAALSPLLNTISKKLPYDVPQGYFESLRNGKSGKPARSSLVVSITSRKWFRYAAAAVVGGILVVS